MKFEIKAEKLRAVLDDPTDPENENNFYWFSVLINIQLIDCPFSLKDIVMVKYQLIDDTIENGEIRVASSKDNFGYQVWLWGFVKASAQIFTRNGECFSVPPTKLSWEVTPIEIAKNGEDNLSWD